MEQTAFTELKSRLAPLNEAGIEKREMNEQEINALQSEQAEELVALFGGNVLIPLPERERTFFSWLRKHDPHVWNDLWGSDEDESYYVSLSHLTSFMPKQRGFPICDLVEHDNYYFTSDEITESDGKVYVESALDIVAENGKLSMDQAFMVEVWRGPIDQWRFAYMYNLPLAEVKKMVHWLISEGVLGVPRQRPENEPPIESAPPSNGEAAHD